MEIDEKLQLDLLRYIRTRPKLFSLYHKDAWDVVIGATYQVLDAYNTKYGVLPSNFDTVYMFMNDYAASLHMDSETVFGDVTNIIRSAFEPPRLDISYLQPLAVSTAQKLQAFAVFNKHLVAMTTADTEFDINGLSRELGRIANITATDQQVERRRLLADINLTATNFTKHNVYKSSIDEINAWRTKGGFYAPELYVLAAPPKALKTMTLLGLGIDFALMNKINVLYIDTENGVANIHQRGAQNITGASFTTYSIDKATEIALAMLQEYGCDVYIRGFRPGQATYQDIEEELEELAAQGIIIGMIIYDYADNMVPVHMTRESHKNAAQVYLDLIGVNMKYSTASWTASQIKAEYIKSDKYIDKGALGQAIAKVHHAHGIFSLLGTKEERALGLRRLAPVTQREGVEDDDGANMIYIRVEPATQRILGVVNKDEVEAMLEAYESNGGNSNPQSTTEFSFKSKINFDSLDDK